jgi:hypothetical protein
MRYFDKIQTALVGEDLVAKAKAFARNVTHTIGTPGRGYEDTAQTNLLKIEYDNYVSKIGEEAVRITFERYGARVEGPDYQIYLGKQKSWAADLLVDGVALAVKTQTAAAAKMFELSWTFQAGERRRDPILQQPEAWVCFVEFNEEKFECRVFPPQQIKELQFNEPKLIRLKGQKKVVYAKSLRVL